MRKALGITVLAVLVAWFAAGCIWRMRHGRRPADFEACLRLITGKQQKQSTAPSPVIVTASAPETKDVAERAMATAACGRDLISEKNALRCPVCPKGSDDADEEPGLNSGWTADSALFGHFTAAGADEALLHTLGCETHASGMGGDFLLRRSASAWSLVRYVHGGSAKAGCQTLPWPAGELPGPDAVICEYGDMHQGIASDTLFFSRYGEHDPADPPTGEHASFITLIDESETCNPDGGPLDGPAQINSIKHWQLLPPDSLGRRDLKVDVQIETRQRQMDKTCRPGTPKNWAIRFVNLGDHFQAGENVAVLKTMLTGDENTIGDAVTPDSY